MHRSEEKEARGWPCPDITTAGHCTLTHRFGQTLLFSHGFQSLPMHGENEPLKNVRYCTTEQELEAKVEWRRCRENPSAISENRFAMYTGTALLYLQSIQRFWVRFPGVVCSFIKVYIPSVHIHQAEVILAKGCSLLPTAILVLRERERFSFRFPRLASLIIMEYLNLVQYSYLQRLSIFFIVQFLKNASLLNLHYFLNIRILNHRRHIYVLFSFYMDCQCLDVIPTPVPSRAYKELFPSLTVL